MSLVVTEIVSRDASKGCLMYSHKSGVFNWERFRVDCSTKKSFKNVALSRVESAKAYSFLRVGIFEIILFPQMDFNNLKWVFV